MNPRIVYALAALALFAIEVVIALFVRDSFVRPYVGDALAVMLVYVALRAATPLRFVGAIAVALAIAFGVEVAQAFHLLDALGLGGNQLARIVFGGLFDWLDLAAYTAGAAVVVAVEMGLRKPR
jgi:Protein of unknown function (DUF2809)